MTINLASLFTMDAIVRYLKQLPLIKTTVMDTIFTDRPQNPLPLVGADLITVTLNTLPVVRRGAPSIPCASETGGIVFYEPLPLRPKKNVTGADLNNLKLLNRSGLETWAREKTDYLRQIVRRTTEGLCAKSLAGMFQWPVQLESGQYETWEVNFGTILSVTPGTLWTATGAKLKDVYVTLQAMEEAIQEKGYGSTVKIWAGKTTFEKLFALAEASVTTAKLRVEITEQGINVGGYQVERRAEKIMNPQTKALSAIVADNDVMMIATDAQHKLVYSALDDLDANLVAMPLFIKPIPIKDPSGYSLVGESKPFPIPNVNGICKATVCS